MDAEVDHLSACIKLNGEGIYTWPRVRGQRPSTVCVRGTSLWPGAMSQALGSPCTIPIWPLATVSWLTQATSTVRSAHLLSVVLVRSQKVPETEGTHFTALVNVGFLNLLTTRLLMDGVALAAWFEKQTPERDFVGLLKRKIARFEKKQNNLTPT